MSDNDNTVEARLDEASEQLVASFSNLDTEAELRTVRSGSLPADGSHEHRWRPRWLAVAAAVALLAGGTVAIAVSIAMRSEIDSTPSIATTPDTAPVATSTPAVTEPIATDPTQTTTVATTEPSASIVPVTAASVATTSPRPTTGAVATTAPTSTTPPLAIAVSYLDPPPMFEPTVFAELDLAVAQIALGDGIVVAGDDVVGFDDATATPIHGRELHVLDLADGSTQRVEVDRVPRALIAGPGPVAYGELFIDDGDRIEQRFVAIALTGERTGELIFETPSLGHAVDPLHDDYFQHGADGIVDVDHGHAVMTPYLEPDGTDRLPDAIEWPVVTYDEETSSVIRRNGPEWQLAIERHPDAPSTMANRAAAGSSDNAVYSTWIGPRIGDDPDYGTPTVHAIAALHSDGTGTWYQLPDGWKIADSNRWGTLLARRTDTRTQLAWFDPVDDETVDQ